MREEAGIWGDVYAVLIRMGETSLMAKAAADQAVLHWAESVNNQFKEQ